MISKIYNKNILFIANGNEKWIGGLYYVKNILYTLLKNNMIDSSCKVYILCKKKNMSLFNSFLKYRNVKILIYNNDLFNKIIKKITNIILKRILDIELLLIIKKFNINYIYPVTTYPFILLKNKCIFWIPDFQHIHLPKMFSKEEIILRNKIFKYIAMNHKILILSSEDEFNDYKSLYPNNTKGVYVLNFESYIDDDIKDIDNKFIQDTIKKYNLPKKFIILSNQFWKHKNHIIVFKAINYLKNNNKKICLVCTGNTKDYRNKNYFIYLLDYIKNNKLENYIKILGLISRKEQLALMIASKIVIQPSLFEGWGTVVEDAKALNKKIIMSNINVHNEQKNNNCILFNKDDEIELANYLEREI